jgi:hypothetical protein
MCLRDKTNGPDQSWPTAERDIVIIKRIRHLPTNCKYYFLLLFILTANGFLPSGSGTTVGHNTQITHITQNNTTLKQNTAHKTTHIQ